MKFAALTGITVLAALFLPPVTQAQVPLDVNSPIGQIINNMPENSWAKLNTNRFDSTWTIIDQRPGGSDYNLPTYRPSTYRPSSILSAWSSMAWDSNRGKMIFWGGGHANYPGNEIYLWNSYDGKWSRASLPSDIKLVSPETGDKIWFNTIDGYMNSPMASHTYQNNQFLPIADKFIVFGGAAHNNGGPLSILNANGQKQQTGPYFWNPAKADVSMVGGLDGSNVNPVKFPNVLGGKMWENRDNITDIRPVTILSNGTVFSGHSWLNGTAVYSDERPDADVIYISDIYELFKYTVVDVNDSSKDVWEKVGDTGTAASGLGVAAIEPHLNIYVRTYGLPLKQFGDSPVLCYWNLNIKNSKKVCFRPTDASGEFNYRKLGFYGMAYDPKRQQLILWDGTDKIWALVAPATLSPLGWHFEKIYDATMDGNQNVPVSGLPDSVLTGILGKWKYIPGYDIFIGVNTYLSGEVWAYKPKNWQPKLN